MIFSQSLADLLARRRIGDLVPWSATVVALQEAATAVKDPLDDVLAELCLLISGQRFVLPLQR